MIPKSWTRPQTDCVRAKLPCGGTPWTGPAALSPDRIAEIMEYDNKVELIFNPYRLPRPAVELYRIKVLGASPESDLLVYQETFFDPPKGGLLHFLRKNDQWAKYGSIERSVKQRKYLMKSREDERNNSARKMMNEIAQDMTTQLKTHGFGKVYSTV